MTVGHKNICSRISQVRCGCYRALNKAIIKKGKQRFFPPFCTDSSVRLQNAKSQSGKAHPVCPRRCVTVSCPTVGDKNVKDKPGLALKSFLFLFCLKTNTQTYTVNILLSNSQKLLPGHYAVICAQSLAKQERAGVIVAQRTMKQVEW